MSKKVNLDQVDEIIEQFQRSGMRELHLRYDDFELYLSSDPNDSGLFAGAPTQAAASAVSATESSSSKGPGSAHGATARETSRALPSAPSASPAASPAASPLPEWPPEATIVRAPYLGTFYRAPKPGSPSYVELGAVVTAESELCIVEVMKLFTAIRAGVSGKVHAILAKDGQMIEANQPLFILMPVS